MSAAFIYLADMPEQRALLRSSPEEIPAAVEELLRFDAPIQWLARVVTRPVAIHGVEVDEGDLGAPDVGVGQPGRASMG